MAHNLNIRFGSAEVARRDGPLFRSWRSQDPGPLLGGGVLVFFEKMIPFNGDEPFEGDPILLYVRPGSQPGDHLGGTVKKTLKEKDPQKYSSGLGPGR